MADSMKNSRKSIVVSCKWVSVAAPLVIFCVGVYAEELTDPTMPPASMAAPVAESVAVVKPAGLQSILISKHRRAAIIDGETVELGGIHGAAKLIEVNEGNVVLGGAQGRQVLSLFPDVSKIPQKTLDEPVHAGSIVDAKILNTHSRREKK
jgi:MSHA biogenesis protein MshK